MDEFENNDSASAGAGLGVGAQLKAAREAQGLSIEDVAAQTRIPTRHLASLEESDWERLPAPTYTMGFAKAYASAVGLDREAIGEQLRFELGSWTSPYAQPEVFEPSDPKRAMPRGLVIGALAAVALLIALVSFFNRRAIEGDDTLATASEPSATPAPTSAPAPAPAVGGAVVLTANEAVWLKIDDGSRNLFQGELAQGQTFEVPADAANPVLTTGRPESIRVSVGTADAPPLGEAGRTVSGLSLKAASLLNPARTAAGATAAVPVPTPRPAVRPAPRAAPAPAETAPPAPAQPAPAQPANEPPPPPQE